MYLQTYRHLYQLDVDFIPSAIANGVIGELRPNYVKISKNLHEYIHPDYLPDPKVLGHPFHIGKATSKQTKDLVDWVRLLDARQKQRNTDGKTIVFEFISQVKGRGNSNANEKDGSQAVQPISHRHRYLTNGRVELLS